MPGASAKAWDFFGEAMVAAEKLRHYCQFRNPSQPFIFQSMDHTGHSAPTARAQAHRCDFSALVRGLRTPHQHRTGSVLASVRRARAPRPCTRRLRSRSAGPASRRAGIQRPTGGARTMVDPDLAQPIDPRNAGLHHDPRNLVPMAICSAALSPASPLLIWRRSTLWMARAPTPAVRGNVCGRILPRPFTSCDPSKNRLSANLQLAPGMGKILTLQWAPEARTASSRFKLNYV